MVRTPWILFLLVVFHAGFAVASVLTESFSSAAQKDPASTAVWNLAAGVVHPTLQIANYTPPLGVPTTTDFDVGDGSHGIFQPSTYANFGAVVGSTITIDASVFPILKFSIFQLDSGYTLTSINGPLIIYSLSTVTIDGTILCSGDDGAPASGANGGAGGIGRCGGNFGGAGGNASADGTQGLPTAGLVVGGIGGNFVGAGNGGGGGGGAAFAGNDGGAGLAGTGGNTGGNGGSGTGGANHQFSNLAGSPGGGGGSGSNTQGGSGGGGGGGTVIIHAVGSVSISATGIILALGGNGGAAASGGGGGGGGGVKIFSAVNVILIPGIPLYSADVTGGTGGGGGAGGNGGSGSFGRAWLISPAGVTGGGSESNPTSISPEGTIQYVTTAQTAVSKSYDTGSSLTVYNSVTFNPVSNDVALQISGSDDNFVVDDTGWLNSSQVASLEKKRFVKFRLILTNSNSLVPTQISEVTVNYEPGTIEVFQFKSGCGSIARGTPLPGNQALLIMLLLLFPLLVAQKLKTVKAKQKN